MCLYKYTVLSETAVNHRLRGQRSEACMCSKYRPRERDSGDEAVPDREAVTGKFGLIPHYSKDDKVKFTYNARSETVTRASPFRDAWKWGNHCIIPAWAIWEPDWRSGRNTWTRIGRSDGRPMGIAGL